MQTPLLCLKTFELEKLWLDHVTQRHAADAAGLEWRKKMIQAIVSLRIQ